MGRPAHRVVGRLMDDMDRAQLQEEMHRAAALERAASMARQALGHAPTSTICWTCGGEIEPVRITYGFGTCASCARDAEYFQKHRTYR